MTRSHGAPRGILALLMLLLAWPVGVRAADALIIEARTPAKIDVDAAIHFASNINGWNPSSSDHRLRHVRRDGDVLVWRLSLPRADVERFGDGIEFKLTRGGWEAVEVNAQGHDVPNRRVGAVDWSRPEIVIVADVAAFRSEPPPPPPETVTGDLRLHEFQSVLLGNRRTVRVWLPPGYDDEPQRERLYPVLYMHDGQNLFSRSTSAFGSEWEADEAASRLIEAGEIEPLIIVGIDNAGMLRGAEYNPPQTSLEERPNHGDRYVRMLTEELMPFIERTYRVRRGEAHTGIGGSSFGGNISLYALMTAPGVFGFAIIESPAVWIGEGELLRHAQAASAEVWPRRMYLAVGDQEGGVRDIDKQRWVIQMRELEAILRAAGMDEQRLRAVVGEGAAHNEVAWAARFPEALRFLRMQGD